MADNFTYYPFGSSSSGIDQSKLKHHYFVQLSADGQRLVPGVLQQAARPHVGKWIDVGNVTRTFSKRHFVKYTNVNTLVPGSLIQSNRRPKGHWEEVRMISLSHPDFYRVVFETPYIMQGEEIMDYVAPFSNNKMIPLINQLFPEISSPSYSAIMYYFEGNYAQLIQDTTQMVPFDDASFMKIYSPYFGNNSGSLNTSMGFGEYITASTEMPAGTYSIIFELTYPTSPGKFVVMENVLIRQMTAPT